MQRGISVVPVIGIMHDKAAFHPVANAAEVEAIFDAPLEMFLKVCFICSIFCIYFEMHQLLLLIWHFCRSIPC